MKKFVILATLAVAVLITPAVSNASSLSGLKIGLYQTLGGASAYDATTEIIQWSGGVDAWFLTSDMTQFVSVTELQGYESSYVSATFSNMTDNSAGGTASAEFASGTWEMGMYATINSTKTLVARLTGSLSSNFNETETLSDPQYGKHLDGRAVVMVDTEYFLQSWWNSQALVGTDVHWDGLGEKAGIIGDTTLPVGVDPADYSQDYNSSNLIVTLWADESQIPEPATIGILSLGLLMFRKKR